MAFNELDLRRIQKAAEAFLAQRRPPVHLRRQVDLAYRVQGQSVELVEIRPLWDQPAELLHRPFAKATFVRARIEWRVYWMRGNLRWHAYDPPVAATVQGFFELVDADPHGCFFG